MLAYVDDILCISLKAQATLSEMTDTFKFKNDLVAPPETYLGAQVAQKFHSLKNCEMWTMTSTAYLKAAIQTIETNENLQLPRKCHTPLSSGYRPETDVSEELLPDRVTYFQEIIGILRWSIEIGRVDVLFEVSSLSAYQASPRQGHLDQALHILGYLKEHIKLTLYFDPSPITLPETIFRNNRDEFREQYRDAIEELPHNMPPPRGREVKITAYCDSDHATNKVTRRSQTGYLIFIQSSPILWYSKRQNTVESSTFGAEFIAMKTCTEQIIALRIKLRMFGIPIDGPADVLGDNEAVVRNVRDFESTLKAKHNQIAYHRCREAVAAGIIHVGKVHTDWNLSDALTKALNGEKRGTLFDQWTY